MHEIMYAQSIGFVRLPCDRERRINSLTDGLLHWHSIHTYIVATNINSSTGARWVDQQPSPLQLGRGIVAHYNVSLFFPQAARLMQCTRPQAADWLARRRRIDQEMEMETQRQTQPQPPQKRTRFAKRSSSRPSPECRLRWDRRRSFHVSK
jgi:hypothetical protein